MRFSNVCFEAFGYTLPPLIVTSAKIEDKLSQLYEKLKLPFGRLEMMSGIRERRFWEEGTTPSQASTLAGRDAIEKSGIEADEIECLLHTSVCRDFMEPASATLVHRALKLADDATVFDISNACLGFLNGIVTLGNMIELGQVKKGLIVAGEGSRQLVENTISTLINMKDPTRKSIKDMFASLTLGSGACALVMAHKSVSKFGHRLLGGAARCASGFNHLCHGDFSAMSTDSETLLKEGCRLAHSTWEKTKRVLGWTNEIVDRVFCHQVGSAHRRELYNTLEMDQAKDFSTFEFLGNAGAVSLPITMAMGLEKKVPARAENIAMLGIGSGLNCLMLGVEWQGGSVRV
ncbi:MAG TPA: 3-oxoacyl-ACP synthase III [Planctomycetota bacterium]|nr:3-oxoacyl-ACP synthase III [Planctomycetota bacterium]